MKLSIDLSQATLITKNGETLEPDPYFLNIDIGQSCKSFHIYHVLGIVLLATHYSLLLILILLLLLNKTQLYYLMKHFVVVTVKTQLLVLAVSF